MTFLIYPAVFSLAVLVCMGLTWFVRNVAESHGWVSVPESERHLHVDPIPRLGGIAVFATFALVCALLMIGSPWLAPLGFHVSGENLMQLLVPGGLIFLVGLTDDIFGLTARVKFVFQIVTAVVMFSLGLRVVFGPMAGHPVQWAISLAATVFWVLWITNAYNLIDGLDGLAAGCALFSTSAVCMAALIGGNHLVAILTVGLAGAILGFLRFNFNPASIFLGDCGSLFIGFMLSSLSLAGSTQAKTSTILAVAIPLVAFGLPLFELGFSVLRRFLSGQPLFTADREHIHHKLLELGLTQKQVAILLYGISALCAALSLSLLYPGRGMALAVVTVFLGLLWIAVRRLPYREFSELSRLFHRTIEQKKVIINNLALRKAVERLYGTSSFEEICQVLQEAFENNAFDGFYLSLRAPVVSSANIYRTDTVLRLRQGEVNHEWHKSGDIRLLDDPKPGWRLTLELEAGGHEIGLFTVYRLRTAPDLLVDVNLVTTDLQAGLCAALGRVMVAEDWLAKGFRITATEAKANKRKNDRPGAYFASAD